MRYNTFICFRAKKLKI